MASNEFWFAFFIVPVYLGITYSLWRSARARNATLPVAFAANWAIAAALFGTYSALTGLGEGNWIGVCLFSGTLAACLATAISGKLSLGAVAK